MAETIIDAERTALAANSASRITHVTLYNGDPEAGGTEAANLAARGAITWAAGAAGVQNKSGGDITLTISGASSFDYLVGIDSATLAAGTPRTKKSIGSNSFGAGGGTVTVSSGSITITSA